MPFNLDWKGDDIPNQLAEPFYQANELLGRAFTKEITSNKWDWNAPPSPRDIVDNGQLRDSYQAKRGREGGDPIFDHSWPVEYAMAVHEGAVFDNGMIHPQRPWTRDPLRDGVLESAFDKLANARLK